MQPFGHLNTPLLFVSHSRDSSSHATFGRLNFLRVFISSNTHTTHTHTHTHTHKSSVRLGDPNNEGIIHPCILEISLLGGLGCGGRLLQMVLDKAERGRQYDYAVLQVRETR